MSDTTGIPFPSITIIFLTYNGMPLVEVVLKAIRQQTYAGKYEILNIDSTSTDETFRVCKEYCDRQTQISPKEFHHARTRNFGVSMSTSDICVFLSQDALPADNNWLTRLIDPFLDFQVGAVYGRQEAPASFGPQRQYSMSEVYPTTRQIRKFNPGEKRSLHDIRFSNANGAVRRELLVKFPFPEFVLLSEDVAACHQVLKDGHTVVYEPASRVIHGHERSIKEEFGWAFDAGVSLKRLGILGNPEFSSETSYGIRKMAGEMAYFAKRGALGTTMLSAGVYIARWLGVQLGKRERLLPTTVLRMMSPTLSRAHRLEECVSPASTLSPP